MAKTANKERRLYPRVDQNLPVQVVANGYDFSTQTQNISCLGAYCHIEKYVPPFTRVMVKMVLPTAGGNERKKDCVECKGVIVRTEDVAKGGYNVAIFFNGIHEGPRKKISDYISRLMPQFSSSGK